MKRTMTPLLLAVATMLAVTGDGAPDLPPRVAAADAQAAPVAPVAPAHLQAPAPAMPAPAASLQMPDGTLLPPLNGAVDPPRPRWQRGRAYSPVVRTDRLPDGRDTYVHEDGSRTTTWMTWRKDLGRMVAVTSVTSPVDAVLLAGDDPPPGR